MENYGAKYIDGAILPGFKLEILRHANIVPANGSMWGVLWEIDEDILKMLDRIEGYPSYYRRIQQTVTTRDGKKYSAQIYVMTNSSRATAIDSYASLNYVKSIAEGYKAANIPLAQLKIAVREYNARNFHK